MKKRKPRRKQPKKRKSRLEVEIDRLRLAERDWATDRDTMLVEIVRLRKALERIVEVGGRRVGGIASNALWPGLKGIPAAKKKK